MIHVLIVWHDMSSREKLQFYNASVCISINLILNYLCIIIQPRIRCFTFSGDNILSGLTLTVSVGLSVTALQNQYKLDIVVVQLSISVTKRLIYATIC